MVFKYFLKKRKTQSSKQPAEQKVVPARNQVQCSATVGSLASSEIGSVITPPSEPNGAVFTQASVSAKRFFDEYNVHNADGVNETMSPTCIIEFAEAEMLCKTFMDENRNILKSFPDIIFTYDTIIDIAPSVVTIVNLRVTATHTGAPYSFGPYPPIEPKGCKIKLDREDTTMAIDPTTGLIIRMKIVPGGRLTGPPGLYEQIGGILF